MAVIDGFVSIEEVLQSLPHKFQNGKNVRVIFEAYLKQYNKILDSYVKQAMWFGLNQAKGDQLDKIGKNFLVSRRGLSDEDYRDNIRLAWAVYKVSGNVSKFRNIFKEYLNLDTDVLKIIEKDNANVALEINRNNKLTNNIISTINEIIQFGKPVGVGFSIEPYSSVVILDTYEQHAIEQAIDRYFNVFMIDDKIMDNAYHMYSTYFMNCSVDRYEKATMEVI